MENQLLVRKIDHGTVIDHIPAWRSDDVMRLLDVEKVKNMPDVSLISLKNVPSGKLGRKDIIKINHFHMEEKDADLVCLLFPQITINYIDNWKPIKYEPRVPDKVVGKIRCPEVNCITNAPREPITTSFTVLTDYNVLQCDYCDSLMEFREMPKYIDK